jgi:hypothetical protein
VRALTFSLVTEYPGFDSNREMVLRPCSDILTGTRISISITLSSTSSVPFFYTSTRSERVEEGLAPYGLAPPSRRFNEYLFFPGWMGCSEADTRYHHSARPSDKRPFAERYGIKPKVIGDSPYNAKEEQDLGTLTSIVADKDLEVFETLARSYIIWQGEPQVPKSAGRDGRVDVCKTNANVS